MASFNLPAYHFAGEIVVTEQKGFRQAYLDFPFDVPPEVGALRLRLQYAPPKVRGVSNLITLGLFDPHGFRGNAHRNPPDHEVILSARHATPGFISGAIPAGAWLAQLALQAVLADDLPCRYALEIELLLDGESVDLRRPSQPPQAMSADRPGWYRGELHSHTLHSDGRLTPDELVALARENQLDFLAVTDHNTVTALAEIDHTHLNGLIVIPGIELTTFFGHALALGVERWIDWRTGYHGWTMEDAARSIHTAGGLLIIAHPQDVPSPVCTGCRWEYPDFDLDLVDGIEIWNGHWWGSNNKNPKNLRLWQELQSGPHRIPATAGTDLHGKSDWGEGRTQTYVHASGLSVAAILAGIRQGRMMLSSGPWLSLELAAGKDGERAGIGSTLVSQSRHVILEAGWEKAPQGACLVALRDRQDILSVAPVAEAGSLRLPLEVHSGDRFWLELFAQDGALLAITNPVYIG